MAPRGQFSMARDNPPEWSKQTAHADENAAPTCNAKQHPPGRAQHRISLGVRDL